MHMAKKSGGIVQLNAPSKGKKKINSSTSKSNFLPQLTSQSIVY